MVCGNDFRYLKLPEYVIRLVRVFFLPYVILNRTVIKLFLFYK